MQGQVSPDVNEADGRDEREYDVLAVGRSSIDLYANEIGAPFVEIKSFAAYVGGCPTNVCVGARRLGLRAALLTAVGEDHVGDFVLNFLAREGVETGYSRRKAGRRTSAFLLGIEPPDRFSLVPYRDNCADLELTTEDVRAAPVADARALLVTGSGLSRQPSRDATLLAAGLARSAGTEVFLDLDYRAELWPDTMAYASALRALLPLADFVLGTADETGKAAGRDASVAGGGVEAVAGVESIMSAGPEALVVKRGGESTLVYARGGGRVEAAAFPVPVCNVLGAGDAFAAGFIYGRLKAWDLYRAARLGNACGAILVTRHGCANFMPTEQEALSFVEERGGF